MAWWDGLLGGGDSSDPLDIYGDLFSEKQKAALAQRSAGEGLLRMAGAFGKAAQPSRMPTSFMGALGEAAGALAGSGDEAAERALKAMKLGEDVRESRAKREALAAFYKKLAAARAQEVAQNLPPGTLTSQVPGAPAPPGDGGDHGGSTGTPGTTGDYPTGAPQPPGTPPLNALGMPAPRDNTAFGIPRRPETFGYMQPAPEQPPAVDPAGAPPRVTGKGVMPRGGLVTPDDYSRYLTGAPPAPPPPAAGQQNTGLLPPQDQVVGPDGQPLQGPGVLPNIMAASYGGAPGGTLPFARASSTPPGTPTGGATRPAAGGPRGKAIEYFTKQGWTPEQAAGIAANLEAESSWRKDVPGDSGQAFGYAQWHPPRQEQFKRVFGKDIRNATEEEQLAFVNWELNNTEKSAGDRLRNAASPRDAAAIVSKYYERPADVEGNAARRGRLAEQIQGGGDYVIPSGRGIPRNALTNVADTGGVPGMPPGGAGIIPGLNMTTQDALELNLLAKMGGLGDVVSPFLEQYYKSPGYIAEAERTRARAGKEVELQMDPLIREQTLRAQYKVDMQLKPELEAAVARLQSPILKEREQAKADIERVTKELEQVGAAALRPNDATVVGPDGQPTTQRLTDLEFAKRQQNKAERVAKGDMRVLPGDIVGTPVLSPEETEAQKQRGKTGQEMTTVEVWTPAGKVSQQMSNSEAAARRKIASERGPGAPPQVGDIVDAPALTEAEKKVAAALGEDFVALRRQAQAASSTISSTHDLRAKLDSGMFTGMDANWNLFAARLGDTLGWKNLSDPEKVKNTEVYISGIGKEVLAMAQALKPASNLDLQFLERAAGGINLSAASVRELLNMRERYARLAIERHNEEARGMSSGTFSGFRREIPLPPEYQTKELTTPSGNKATINR